MLDCTQVAPATSNTIFNNPNIRTTPGPSNGESWYCAKDLTGALGKRWVNAKQNLGILRKRDKRLLKITTKRGRQKTWFISRQGAEELLENESTAGKASAITQGVISGENKCKESGSTLGVFAENDVDIIPSRPKSPSVRPPKRPTPDQVIALVKKLTPAQFEQLRDRYYWRLEEAARGERQPPALHRDLSDSPPPLLHATLLLDDVANKELRKLDAVFEAGGAA